MKRDDPRLVEGFRVKRPALGTVSQVTRDKYGEAIQIQVHWDGDAENYSHIVDPREYEAAD